MNLTNKSDYGKLRELIKSAPADKQALFLSCLNAMVQDPRDMNDYIWVDGFLKVVFPKSAKKPSASSYGPFANAAEADEFIFSAMDIQHS